MNNCSRGGKIATKVFAALMTALVACVCIVSFANPGTQVYAYIGQPELSLPTLDEVECTSYCVYDKTANQILLSKVCHNRIFPASMTKIMTFQLGLDYLDYGEDSYLTVSQNAIDNVSSDSTLMGVSVGEVVKVSELFYGMMLPSGNDAANVVAEGVIDALFENYPEGGEVGPDGVNASYFVEKLGISAEDILSGYKLTAFAELMNLRAENIGCLNTHFVNAHGLHDDQHYTTSSDLTLIMANACQNPDFCTVISSTTHIFEATNYHTQDGWSMVTNTNHILADPWLCATLPDGTDTHIAAFVGGKTGTTSRAGTCMTTYSVNENGHELFISVCGIAEYSNQTRYVASVVAYGNYACWETDPVSVLPGTTSDYRNFNTTAAELPQCDPLIMPWDTLPESYQGSGGDVVPDGTVPETSGDAEVTPDDGVEVPTVSDETTPDDDSTSDGELEKEPGFWGKIKLSFFDTELGKFVAKNLFISGVVVSLVFIIIVLLIVLIIRTIRNNMKYKRRNKVRPFKGNLDTFS